MNDMTNLIVKKGLLLYESTINCSLYLSKNSTICSPKIVE